MIQIYDASQVSLEQILARTEEKIDVSAPVAHIIETVRAEGDAALRRYAKEFDGADLASIEVTAEELDQALATLEPEFVSILEQAAANIRDFHSRQIRQSFIISEKNGIVLGQKVTPIERVGLYIPGGTAAYPSSVLMNCIPAKLAGCSEIVMVSPPSRGGDSAAAILAAADIGGRIVARGNALAHKAKGTGQTDGHPRQTSAEDEVVVTGEGVLDKGDVEYHRGSEE